MTSKPSLAADWDDYLTELRKDAHQLLAWSYADVRPKLVVASDEYEMTGLLADGMDARINSPQTPERFMLYAIHNEKPTNPLNQLGKRRPRLDIQIERCGVRPKPYFTFEAKRLRDDASSSANATMRQYLGDEGIFRFINGLYASDSIEAAMLGCIQAHNAEYWFRQVADRFASDALREEPMFALVGGLQLANVIPDFPDERVSIHARPRRNAIQIFHLFIDCRSGPN